MKRPIFRLCLACAVMMLFVAPMAAAGFGLDDSYRVVGQVVGGDGVGLPGVMVELAGDGVKQKAVSDADGGFRFTSIGSGNYTLVCKKRGLKKVTHRVLVADSDVDLGSITME